MRRLMVTPRTPESSFNDGNEWKIMQIGLTWNHDTRRSKPPARDAIEVQSSSRWKKHVEKMEEGESAPPWLPNRVLYQADQTFTL